jgi:hypothetical protein
VSVRLALVAALIALSPAAHADGIDGWWKISGTTKSAPPSADKGGGFGYAAPPNTDKRKILGTAQGQVFACVYNRDGTPTEGSRAYGCSEFPEPDALYRAEPTAVSAPGTCGFSGQLAVKESKAGTAKGECSLSLIYGCPGEGRHMSVVQACTVSRKGGAISIKGANPEILEAVPPHAWPASYPADTLELSLSSDGKTLAGKLAGKPKSAVSLTKFLDIVE